MSVPVVSLDALTRQIRNGAKVALPPDYSGTPMAAVLSLIKQGVRDLHLVGVPVLGFLADQLIGAQCVARVESAAVTLGEYGLAPRFTAALKSGELEMWDATCPAIHAGLQAAEKGVPFMPLRGLIGSDLLRVRPDWRVIQNPIAESGTDDPIVVLPAIKPDVALFHCARADVHGNVWIGIRRELMLMSHAAKATYVTVERIENTNFLTDPAFAAGTIPSLYVSAIAVQPNGAAPVGLVESYEPDHDALKEYALAARSADGFQSWLQQAIRTRETV
jgi:glutaconate CoA-transferase, subunit A